VPSNDFLSYHRVTMEEARTGARDVPVDRRASQLELQLEQVQLTLEQLRQTQGSLHEMETRLGDMTRECADILDRWARNDEKHASAVVELHGRLSEWNDVERRLLNESATRVHQFERSLQHEWHALKARHEAPLAQLEAQSTRIAETCITAVEQALKGFDRAEERLSALESNVQREMSQLAAEVRGALSDLRDQQALGARQPWSLDNVVRLHNELRGDDQGSVVPAPAPALATATGTLGLSPSALRAPRTLDAPRLDTARDATPATAAVEDDPDARTGRLRWPFAALLLIVAVGVGYGFYLHNRLSTGLQDAAARAASAEREAAISRAEAQEEIDQVRQAADARLATAEHAATTAQLLAAIVAAPDAKRFELTGAPGKPAVQVLWSRSRGIAASAAALPALPEGRGYQLWLVTRGRPSSVGMLPASPSQPVSAVFAWPRDLVRAVVGAVITVEPSAGSTQPTGTAWLASRVFSPPPGSTTTAAANGS
jgi:hypothetical protein